MKPVTGLPSIVWEEGLIVPAAANLEKLVEAAAHGDREALQCLIVHYHNRLRRRLKTVLGMSGPGRIDPDDVLQQTYIAAFQAIEQCRFDSPAKLHKWLERIALNELRNQHRDLRRKKRDIAREVVTTPAAGTASYPDLMQRLTATQTTPSRRLARSETLAGMMTCLARLSPDQRAVIRLRFLEGRSVVETAMCMQRSENAVHALCYRALKELRRLLGSLTGYLSRL
ncbi:MAG: RNA polymerase sigma factor [Planctomycetota bacterium]